MKHKHIYKMELAKWVEWGFWPIQAITPLIYVPTCECGHFLKEKHFVSHKGIETTIQTLKKVNSKMQFIVPKHEYRENPWEFWKPMPKE